jgi:hypothetical protein
VSVKKCLLGNTQYAICSTCYVGEALEPCAVEGIRDFLKVPRGVALILLVVRRVHGPSFSSAPQNTQRNIESDVQLFCESGGIKGDKITFKFGKLLLFI